MKPVAMQDIRLKLLDRFANHRRIFNVAVRFMIFCRHVGVFSRDDADIAHLADRFDLGFDIRLGDLRVIFENVHDPKSASEMGTKRWLGFAVVSDRNRGTTKISTHEHLSRRGPAAVRGLTMP